MNSPLAAVSANARTIIILGSGGVGKTTTAVTLAVLAASMGRKVGLISIDPAKRLADAMGIKLGHELTRVSLPAEADASGGELWATMLDQKAVFDDMVRRFAPSGKIRDLILQNSIYKAASTKLGGPLEYMAIAKLQQMAEDPNFDLVVLDTPPDTHALDFLVRPNILTGFMENKVMAWLIKPFLFANKLGRGKFLSVTDKIAGGIAAVTGTNMLRKLAEFLVLIEDIVYGFHHAGERVAKLMRRSDTSFVLIAAPGGASLRSAAHMADMLKRENFQLDSLIINRYFAKDLRAGVEAWSEVKEDFPAWAPGFELLSRISRLSNRYASAIGTAVAEKFPAVQTVLVAEQPSMPDSPESIWKFSQILAASPLFSKTQS